MKSPLRPALEEIPSWAIPSWATCQYSLSHKLGDGRRFSVWRTAGHRRARRWQPSLRQPLWPPRDALQGGHALSVSGLHSPRRVQRQQRCRRVGPLCRIAETLKNRGPGTPAARPKPISARPPGSTRLLPSLSVLRPHRATAAGRGADALHHPTRPLPRSNRRIATRWPVPAALDY
jgi:hypothetical protein